MKINRKYFAKYLEEHFGKKIKKLYIETLGKGCIGTGYLVEFEAGDRKYRKVLKSLYSEHMGSEYSADRAQSLILAHHTFNDMENHIGSIDVVGACENGRILPIGGAKEFFILMDEAKGIDLFSDIKRIGEQGKFNESDRDKILALARYLARLHSKKFESETLYKRKIRDTIGSGVSIMGVLDMYPEKLSWFSSKEQAEIVKKAVEHWSKEKYFSHRLCEIHGDFHPGNIWFEGPKKFILLDRSRGKHGEAADDITAFLINFIFFSLVYEGMFSGPLAELFDIFMGEYLNLTKDKDISKVVSPYWAFRVMIVCNPHPVFYPDSFYKNGKTAKAVRRKMINFALNALDIRKFDWKKINDYLC